MYCMYIQKKIHHYYGDKCKYALLPLPLSQVKSLKYRLESILYINCTQKQGTMLYIYSVSFVNSSFNSPHIFHSVLTSTSNDSKTFDARDHLTKAKVRSHSKSILHSGKLHCRWKIQEQFENEKRVRSLATNQATLSSSTQHYPRKSWEDTKTRLDYLYQSNNKRTEQLLSKMVQKLTAQHSSQKSDDTQW